MGRFHGVYPAHDSTPDLSISFTIYIERNRYARVAEHGFPAGIFPPLHQPLWKNMFSIAAGLAAPQWHDPLRQRPILVELAGFAELAAEDDIRAQARTPAGNFMQTV